MNCFVNEKYENSIQVSTHESTKKFSGMKSR